MNHDKITGIFVKVDSFCKEYDKVILETRKLASNQDKKSRIRRSQLSDSELITILIGFHLGAHKCLKHYYLQVVTPFYKNLFTNLLSYNRFVEIMPKAAIPFMLFLKNCCLGTCRA